MPFAGLCICGSPNSSADFLICSMCSQHCCCYPIWCVCTGSGTRTTGDPFSELASITFCSAGLQQGAAWVADGLCDCLQWQWHCFCEDIHTHTHTTQTHCRDSSLDDRARQQSLNTSTQRFACHGLHLCNTIPYSKNPARISTFRTQHAYYLSWWQ